MVAGIGLLPNLPSPVGRFFRLFHEGGLVALP